MIIELDNTLTETDTFRRPKDVETHIGKATNSLYTDKVVFLRSLNDEPTQVGFLDMVATAYSRHQKIAIAPHDMWFLFMTEMVNLVEENTEALRGLFSSSDEKIEISVEAVDTTNLTASMDEFERRLSFLMPMGTSAFVPEFSTHTKESRLATVATVMGMAKKYYGYGMFMCGIPAVKVLGTVSDWTLFRTSLTEIEGKLFDCGVQSDQWFRGLHWIIQNVIDTLNGEDRMSFWKDIFTSENVGSGGQLSIDGWIVKLYRNKEPGIMDGFPHGMVAVPFKDLHNPDINYYSVHGAFYKRTDDDGFRYCHYGDVTLTVGEDLTRRAAGTAVVFDEETIVAKPLERNALEGWTVEVDPETETEIADEAVQEIMTVLSRNITQDVDDDVIRSILKSSS